MSAREISLAADQIPTPSLTYSVESLAVNGVVMGTPSWRSPLGQASFSRWRSGRHSILEVFDWSSLLQSMVQWTVLHLGGLRLVESTAVDGVMDNTILQIFGN